jgi:hypothetical protein
MLLSTKYKYSLSKLTRFFKPDGMVRKALLDRFNSFNKAISIPINGFEGLKLQCVRDLNRIINKSQ